MILHTRGYFPQCLATNIIACDVDEVLWLDPYQTAGSISPLVSICVLLCLQSCIIFLLYPTLQKHNSNVMISSVSSFSYIENFPFLELNKNSEMVRLQYVI